MATPSVFAGALAWLVAATLHAAAMQQDRYTVEAIIHAESRGDATVVKHETNGSCSVGLMGINVPDCEPVQVEHLLSPEANIRAGTAILKQGAFFCREHPKNAACKRGGAIALYNPGDKEYARRIRRVRREMRREILSQSKR